MQINTAISLDIFWNAIYTLEAVHILNHGIVATYKEKKSLNEVH